MKHNFSYIFLINRLFNKINKFYNGKDGIFFAL